MNIRQSNINDVNSIVDLLLDCFQSDFNIIFGKKIKEGEEALTEYYNDEKDLKSIIVAEEDNKIVGICCLKMNKTRMKWPYLIKIFIKKLGVYKGLRAIILGDYLPASIDHDKCLLDFICVDKNYRKKGIGNKLLNYSEKYTKNQNKKIIFSFIQPKEKEIHILIKFGFKEKKIKKSIISKIFFKKPIWIYIEKNTI